jgi:hypothetical protein
MWTYIRRGGWLTLLGVLLLVGLGITYAILSNRYARLEAEGIPVTATVTGGDATTSTSTGIGRRSTGSTTTTYRVDVRYTAPDPSTGADTFYEGRQQVSNAFYDSVGIGSKIQIRILPDRPKMIEIEPGYMAHSDLTALLFIMAFPVLAIVLGQYLVSFFNGRARLASDGQSVLGTVTKVALNGRWTSLKYSFSGPDGRSYKGKTNPRQGNPFPRVAAGSGIEVIYDPVKPRRNAWRNDLRR